MNGFEWGHRVLGMATPQELQGHGVQVYFAPNVRAGEKLVNLANGQIVCFEEEEPRPKEGFFAEQDSLTRFCELGGAEVRETNGQLFLQRGDLAGWGRCPSRAPKCRRRRRRR